MARLPTLARAFPNPLGDACMAIPAVRALKRARPGLSLTVTCRENLAPLWESCDAVDAVIPFAKGLSPSPSAGS